MTQDEAKALYEGKYFYEVVDYNYFGADCKLLFGPLDNIRYINKEIPQKELDKKLGKANVAFVQIIDGIPKAAFNENEILVTDKLL